MFSFSLQCVDRMGTRERKWRQRAPCMHEKSQQGLIVLGGRQGLKLLLNTTWAEGNTRDKDHAHRHEKSQGGIFLRVGAVEAAILYTLVCGYFKR